ncbi:MAG: hypothetical protein IKX58_03540, partial [Clostridia bacterium]|nr:hypothetical protein [Clostridia bacterium]
VVDNADGTRRIFATVSAPDTGITMQCSTTLPGVQFYTGNFLCGLEGKYGFGNNRRNGKAQ